VALASDAVTAYAGALGQRPGAVVAGGTGMVALGTDLTRWRRADGWGHLLGDCGGGAWIGRAGLEAALRAHDGREGGSPALLAAAESAFGPARELPDRVYPRPDRPAVLASFAPEVGRCAADGDAVAARILALAARHVAEAAGAVCPEVPRGAPMSATGRRVVAGGPLAGGAPGAVAVAAVGPPEVALTGGLFRMGAPLLVPLREELSRRLPYARLVPAAGDPLDGALVLASALASGSLLLPRHPTLLHVPMESGA
ncbi:N-acetylglucosamine kinase, partial [Streptomyces clavuligerus]